MFKKMHSSPFDTDIHDDTLFDSQPKTDFVRMVIIGPRDNIETAKLVLNQQIQDCDAVQQIITKTRDIKFKLNNYNSIL